MGRPLASLFVGSVILLLSVSPALAYDFEVSARTEAYGYQLRRYDRAGLLLLNRRRVTQYLGLRVFNLLEPGEAPRAGRPPALLHLHGLMRFFTDFGDYARAPEPIAELRDTSFELLSLALEGRNLLGWIDFTAGRQYDLELMDFYGYDGLRLRINTPWRLFVEGHVGAQIHRARLFSPAVFEPDGTSGDPADGAWAPTFGVALGVEDLRHFDLRLAYRRTVSHATMPLLPEPARTQGLWSVDQELLFAALGYRIPRLASEVSANLRYSLLTGLFEELQLLLSQPLGTRHRVHLELGRYRPHFDGDSIFNVFAVEPYSELAARYAVDVGERWQLEARGGYRWFYRAAVEADRGGTGALSLSLGAVARFPRLRAAAEAFFLSGWGGRRAGGDADLNWRLARWLNLQGRVSVASFANDERPSDPPLTSLGVEAGATLRPLRSVALHLTVEDNVSRLYRSAVRMLAVLDVEFAP